MKHNCPDCKHSDDVIAAEFDTSFITKNNPMAVTRDKWEVELLVPSADYLSPKFNDADLFVTVPIYSLLFERRKPLDPSGSRWLFGFRGVRQHGGT